MMTNHQITNFFILSIFSVFSLAGCEKMHSPEAQFETVFIVAYTKGNLKATDDLAMLSDGRHIQIRSNPFLSLIGYSRIRVPEYIKKRNFWQLIKDTSKVSQLQGMEGQLFHRNGELCVSQNCFALMAICPSVQNLIAGEKCTSYHSN